MKSKKYIIVLLILLLVSSTVNATNLGVLSYWSANYTGQITDTIGRWGWTPSVWASPKDSTFTSANFASYVNHAMNQWSNAGISSYGVDNEYDGDIRIYGGSLTTLRGLFPSFPSANAGATLVAFSQEGTWTYLGTPKTGIKVTAADVYIRSVSGQTTNGYRSTTTHEFGHSLGWIGESTNSSDVMYYSTNTVTTLTSRDKNHLNQIY